MTSTDQPADLTLRPASVDEAPLLAGLFDAARQAAVPLMPPHIHPRHEVLGYFRERLQRGDELWVAEGEAAVLGYAHVVGDWLDAIYVHPHHTGRGIGSTLLDLVKALRPGGFALWVFESNIPARRFYRRHGLVELEHTDGSTNEERSPDLRMAWPGERPLDYFRGQVDEVDDELAVVLARRAALTAAIQQVKPVAGHAGRDPDREAEIAERMAGRAPGLEVADWRRIMHEVITVSLDAAERRS